MKKYHLIGLTCPKCGTEDVKVREVGISSEYTMAVNYRCTACKLEGSTEEDICELVAACREADGVLLS